MDGSTSGGNGRCMEGGESDMNRILLRYRPIAPKPVVGGSGGGSAVLIGKRTKRKYVRVCKDKSVGKQRLIETLQLLPEKADLKAEITQLSVGSGDSYGSDLKAEITQLSVVSGDSYGSDVRVLEQNNDDNNNNNFENIWYAADVGGVIESWVTVESVVVDERVSEESNRWFVEDEDRLLMNDNFVRQQFEGESRPGFIAKAESGRVELVNEAYRRMVGCNRTDVRSGCVKTVSVWLEIKEEVAEVISRVRSAFSCWVKVHCNREEDGRRGVSMVLPCDAWRVQRGGFAWRLDTRAALCLGIVADTDGCFRPSS